MKIKFLTINIWFGGKVWDNLVSYIHDTKPDILAIQEVYDGHDPSLEKRFRTIEEFKKEFVDILPYYAFGATVQDVDVNVPWGNAVFLKFPIKNSKTIFFDLPFAGFSFITGTDPRLVPEGMLEAEIDVNGEKLFVYSWHGVWDTHGRDTEKRMLMSDIIVESIKDKKNIILAGDTNTDPDTNAIQNIQDKTGVVSVFGNSLQSTFNMKQKENPENYVNSPVDMVFVSPEFEIVSKEMPEVDVSDHYPLLVELEI